MKKEKWVELAKKNEKEIKEKIKETIKQAKKEQENDAVGVLMNEDGEVYIKQEPWNYLEYLFTDEDGILIISFDAWDENEEHLENKDYWANFYYENFLEKLEKEF